MPKLALIDDDFVIKENLANQIYDVSDIGKHKVNRMREHLIVKGYAGKIDSYYFQIEHEIITANVIAVSVDSMLARSNIFNKHAGRKILYIESRVTATAITVYCFWLNDKIACTKYREQALYDDKDVLVAECGKKSFGATAQLAASFMTIKLVRVLTQFSEPMETIYDWKNYLFQEA